MRGQQLRPPVNAHRFAAASWANSHLHPYRDLAILAEVWPLTPEPRLDEFEPLHCRACCAIPQLRRYRPDQKNADIGIGRAAPPHAVSAFPDLRYLEPIAAQLCPGRKIGFLFKIDEHESDVMLDPISCFLELRLSVTNQMAPVLRSGRASNGRARKPPGNCVVSMQTPTFSMMSHTRSRPACAPLFRMLIA